MQATLIIPQHGRADLTRACLDSIRRHETEPWPIIVVDDGSPDDSADQIARHLESLDPRTAHTSLLRQPHRGLTAAWNHAARSTETPILIFLNNDTQATAPFVRKLIDPLTPACGVAGNPPNAPSSPPSAPRSTGPRLRTETALPKTLLNHLPTTNFLEGWCFALRRDDFDRLGGFDESMTLYWSDTDLQCRLVEHHADHTTLLRETPDVPLRHAAHQTTRRLATRRQQWQADRDKFIAKWTARTPAAALSSRGAEAIDGLAGIANP